MRNTAKNYTAEQILEGIEEAFRRAFSLLTPGHAQQLAVRPWINELAQKLEINPHLLELRHGFGGGFSYNHEQELAFGLSVRCDVSMVIPSDGHVTFQADPQWSSGGRSGAASAVAAAKLHLDTAMLGVQLEASASDALRHLTINDAEDRARFHEGQKLFAAKREAAEEVFSVAVKARHAAKEAEAKS